MSLSSEPVDRDYLVELLSEEKEKHGRYIQLCESYRISPNPIAAAVSAAKVQLLNHLLDGKPKSNSLSIAKIKMLTTK